ncbi:MAG: hypothetical protein F2690_03240 [Actinobacteria bacterium]|uniref:Unannotated protein n=1 Tax=freshwater metagenome TaxID=449393 RepID=A0A6J5ZLQ8_9ZZZZ|nr:hypothetical protein [Actinomycetota bacterium]MSX45426.1 hypothetical protein [Actinomycetota bacterium]MSX72350.1 hypothetical protein [Actinomycetota bacterium]MSY69566.1 hypothetical protein [Actinomycetota bacterium]MTA76340.1 hypothetical protein [Actinomycetota bacterium]
MRKFASVTVALIVAAGIMVALPANAATKVSNGVACTKLNATTTVSGSKYKCAKNPLSTSKKLTWLSIDCLNSASAYTKSQKDAVTLTANLTAQIPVIEVGITTETAHKAEIQTKLDSDNQRLTAAQSKLAAATTAADKKSLTTAVSAWTAAVRANTSTIARITLNIRKLEAAKLAATTQPAQLAADVENTKANAQLICTKGF